MHEIEALQNMADGTGLTVHERHQQDKRRTVKMYFAQLGTATVSPVLDYANMNHFLLGWREALQHKTH